MLYAKRRRKEALVFLFRLSTGREYRRGGGGFRTCTAEITFPLLKAKRIVIRYHHLLQPDAGQWAMAMPAPLNAFVAASFAALEAHESGRLVLQELAADHAVDDGVGGGGALGEEFAREAFGAAGG